MVSQYSGQQGDHGQDFFSRTPPCITFHISDAVSGGPAQVVIRVIVLIIVLIVLRLLRMRLDSCSVCCLSPVQEPRHTLQVENP
jgi:hypothetical protein